MNILVSGASGFLGSALIPKLLKKGQTVYALSRHPPEASENLIPLTGDIIEPNLGLKEVPEDIASCYHLAAVHRLGNNQENEIWATNVTGTLNVITFCEKYGIKQLLFVSTAYTQGRNPYERSKAFGEYMVKRSDIPQITIFKPSIIMGTPQHFYPGHFSQFVALLIKIHQRAETIRKRIEGTLRLPVIEPVFRMQANPGGKLNVISVEDVVDAMVAYSGDEPPGATYWLTHPNPPTIQQLIDWMSEFIMVKIKIESNFEPTPIEAMFQKLSQAFTPYLWGDEFPSHIPQARPITKEFINATLIRTLLSS